MRKCVIYSYPERADGFSRPPVFSIRQSAGLLSKEENPRENGHISRTTNDGIAMAEGEFVALLDCDDLYAENALYEIVKKLNEDHTLDFIYSDEDKLSEDGTKRRNPFFKPDWSPDTFMSLMYTCHLAVYRKSLLDEMGGLRVGLEGSQDYDLVLNEDYTLLVKNLARLTVNFFRRFSVTTS